ncbi:asparagine synthase-related protein [Actinomadura fibrosa]|uniref:Asparagine synthase-related protein n=1 Tax=Actinomadura fibrosa TaxID=111802 RepID=A0ABW2XTA8_9ACTN|nr:asparagine synthase-related protein [Actinomadura fibrosa]
MGALTSPGWYFVMLPDTDAASDVVERLPAGARRLEDHPSGRPWLMGEMPDDQVAVGRARDARVAVLGYSSATAAGLDAAAGRLASVEQLDATARMLAGGFHLLGAADGRLRAQGAASGMRRVFHAVIGGVPVASDRADVLADLGGLPYDDLALAAALVRGLPRPLGDLPLWRGVEPVEPEAYLLVERDGTCRSVTWWRQPDAELSRSEGAEALARALEGAVAARTAAGGVIHCDLSGGLDSTPLCYFAVRGPARVLSHTGYNADPTGTEDLEWARKALPAMPGLEHEAVSMAYMPDFFEGILSARHRMDRPSQAVLAGPRLAAGAVRARDRGARAYLTGLGGDHLLRSPAAIHHTLFRRHPLLALRHVRAAQCLAGKPTLAGIGPLLNRTSYARWLDAQAAGLRRADQERTEQTLTWGADIRLPRWLTDDAAALLARRLAGQAGRARPLGPTRAAHAQLAVVRDGTRISRGVQQLGAWYGIAMESPFFDDRVVEACLSVRLADRDAPTEYKPLIKAAMRGRLPDDFLARSTKIGGAPQAARGLDRYWDELMALCEESGLAAAGLIDLAALREHTRPQRHRKRDGALDLTVNCAAVLTYQRRAAAAVPSSRAGA